MRNVKGFSIIELLISMVVISCLVAAFAPVMTQKANSKRESEALKQYLMQNAKEKTTKEDKKEQRLEALNDVLKYCQIDSETNKLVCDINDEEDEATQEETSVTPKVTYSQRRDKIRFDTKEQGRYSTTVVTNSASSTSSSQSKTKLDYELNDENVIIDRH